jgi:tetratricopeptide (TPR) repeat protein/predicted Ser/Thr protein kinase
VQIAEQFHIDTQTAIDLLEGRIESSAYARVDEHAASCDDCRRLLSSLARAEQPVPDHDLPQTRRYEITHELGIGGMGVVYAARDRELGRRVALKILRGDGGSTMEQRLRREAHALAQLAHPNVVAVHDVGAFGDRMFIAMEYVDGETLARWLAKPRRPRDVLDAFLAAGRGLAAAHAAGIVHRDFKPENVLVGNDGRVRVVDFGLARTGDEPAPPIATGSPGAATTPTQLTASGAVVGTPWYMAPEQYGGAVADARSDQFSFCVALFAALYGERPFAGDTLDELVANVRAGRMREPAGSERVARRVRAAIRRGLAVDPSTRFATLEALLVELEPASRRFRRFAIPFATIVLACSGASAWLVARAATPDDQRCSGGATAFAATWSSQRRVAIARAFDASHAPYAALAAREVGTALDHYADRWVSAYNEACRATTIRGEQTATMLDRRMTCLARRRQEANALVAALESSETSVVARAVDAVNGLSDVATCSDPATLEIAPPSDLPRQLELDALSIELAAVRAMMRTGRFAPALERARSLTAAARVLGHRPFEAEADLARGEIERTLGQTAPAKATLEAAVWAAEASRADEVAARGWVDLVFLVGYEASDHARGDDMAKRASAAIARLGGNDILEARLEGALGAIAADEHKLTEAVAHFEKGVALAEKASAVDVPTMLESLGRAVMTQGYNERALELGRRALAIRERTLGPDHPGVAQSLDLLSNAHFALGDYASAEAEDARALAIREASLGAVHPDLAFNLSDLARVVRRRGRVGDALALDERAVAMGEQAYGPENPWLAQQLVQLGITLQQLERFADSDARLTRAEAIYRKVGDDPQVAYAQRSRADGLFLQKKWRAAAAMYERIIPRLVKAEGMDEELAFAADNLALAYLELGQPTRATRALAAAANIRSDGFTPENRAEHEFVAAQVQWANGSDRARAHERALAARDRLAATSAPERKELEHMDDWLAHHK